MKRGDVGIGRLPMDWVRLGAVLGLICLGGGCSDRDQVASLGKKVAVLESQVKALKISVQSLEQEQSLDRLMRDEDSIVYLTPGSEGYSIVQADLGRLTVMLQDIQPYANGTRITLRFGNLTSATINGAKATMEWGSVDTKGHPKNDTARSRDVSFSQSLRAGAWTHVQVVLEGVPPAELGFVRVKNVTHAGISLLK